MNTLHFTPWKAFLYLNIYACSLVWQLQRFHWIYSEWINDLITNSFLIHVKSITGYREHCKPDKNIRLHSAHNCESLHWIRFIRKIFKASYYSQPHAIVMNEEWVAVAKALFWASPIPPTFIFTKRNCISHQSHI